MAETLLHKLERQFETSVATPRCMEARECLNACRPVYLA
jgi:hypothetical protein